MSGENARLWAVDARSSLLGRLVVRGKPGGAQCGRTASGEWLTRKLRIQRRVRHIVRPEA